MLSNYLKTALRNLWKNKFITLIMVLGLSIGISAALVIYQIVQYQFSFDRYEPDRDLIYRVVTEGSNWANAGVPAPLHRDVESKLSGIRATAAFFDFHGWDTKVTVPQGQDQQPTVFKKQTNIVFADAGYFAIFPHPWLEGSAAASLKTPRQVVLSESRARLYFPGLSRDQIIGKQMIFNDTIPTVVSGIVQDLAHHSDFDNKVFIALATIPHGGLTGFFNWDQWHNINSSNQLLVKLRPGTTPETINRQLAQLYSQHNQKDGFGDETTFRLQPLSDVHFNTRFEGRANLSVLRNLILLALFLLVLGAINFINLSTAQATQRAKEIGIRKTLGSSKKQLRSQFLVESFLLTLVATLVSILLLPFLLNIFSGYLPDGLTYGGIAQPDILLFLLGLIVAVSLLSGVYPALILSNFKPLTVIRGQAGTRLGKTRNAGVRRGLIVFQFVIAQVFIISVLMVNKQIGYAVNKDMGFRKEAIINFYPPFDFFKPAPEKFLLRDKLKQLPGIQMVSLGNQSPAFNGTMTTTVGYKKDNDIIKIDTDSRDGDTNYLKLYQIPLIAGRPLRPLDSLKELLINATLAKRLGFQNPQDAVGTSLQYNNATVTVVGVMADFNASSVRRAVHPLIFHLDFNHGYAMHVALQPDVHGWQKTIAQMQAAWKAVYPDKDFEYTFLDQTIADFYKQDIKLSKLLAWSAGIAIFIGCMGLLGLIVFMANQRTKEIGIRKVLGASVAQIITLLSREFVVLVIVAFLIAVPIAWIIMQKWLQNFAYHATLSVWIFVVSGAAMLGITLLMLAIRAGKAARANPIHSLRSE